MRKQPADSSTGHLKHYFIISHNSHNSDQFQNPVYQSQHKTGKDSVQNHRSGDGKYLHADSEYLSFLLILDTGCRYGICEACDRNKGSGSTQLCDRSI